MIFNLKVLGLALMAILTLGVIGVPSVWAQEEQGLLISKGAAPVTLTAIETGGAGANAITAFNSKIECPESSYTGHKYNVTPHAFILSGAIRVTLSPLYKQECIAAGIWRTTIEMNGCDYVVHLGETVPVGNEEGTYAITTDIICPAGESVAMTIYKTEPDHDSDKPFCILDVKEQTGLKGAHATDLGNGHIAITGMFEGVHMERTSITGSIFCPTQTTIAGKLDVDLTVEARNEAGSLTEISIVE